MARLPLEHTEQAVFFRWLEFLSNDRRIPKVEVNGVVHPAVDFIFAVPNGGYRAKATAVKLKEEGVKSGVPDICFPFPWGKYHGLFIEMKRESGGRISENQVKWLDFLRGQGYAVYICRGFEQAQAALLEYFVEGKENQKEEQ